MYIHHWLVDLDAHWTGYSDQGLQKVLSLHRVGAGEDKDPSVEPGTGHKLLASHLFTPVSILRHVVVLKNNIFTYR